MKNNTKALYVLIIFIFSIGVASAVMTYNTERTLETDPIFTAWVDGVNLSNSSLANYMLRTGTNSNIQYLTFNTTVTPTLSEGQMAYDFAHDGFSMGFPLGTTLQIGQEMYKVVTNLDNITLVEGTPVSTIGVSGNREAIVRTDITNYTLAHSFLGIVTSANCTVNQKCLVTTYGDVHDLNTNSYTEGLPLYVGVTPGSLTNTMPDAPNHIIDVGVVTIKNLNVGVIAVSPHIGRDLNELDDVDGTPIDTTGQILVWNETRKVWDATKNINDYATTATISGIQNNVSIINYTLQNQYNVTQDPTGFRNTSTSQVRFNLSTLNFTISGTNGNYSYYIAGQKCEKTNETITITNTTGIHFVYYTSCGNLIQSTTPWGFEGFAQVAIVYLSPSGYIIGDERHDLGMDWKTHEYLHNTIGTRYFNGLTGSFADTTFNVTAGHLYDENLKLAIPYQNTANVLYRNSTYWLWNYNQTQYYYKNATNMYYDNNGVLTPVPANQYMAVWVYGTNDPEVPIISIVGQRTDTTLSDARTNNNYENLGLLNLPFAEYKILYRVILRNDATPYEETQDLRSISNVPSGTYVATAHGSLTGLTSDDHPQYLLASGSRAATTLTVTNNITVGGIVGTILFGNNASIDWNSSDLCLSGPPNSTGYKNTLCLPKIGN